MKVKIKVEMEGDIRATKRSHSGLSLVTIPDRSEHTIEGDIP